MSWKPRFATAQVLFWAQLTLLDVPRYSIEKRPEAESRSNRDTSLFVTVLRKQ